MTQSISLQQALALAQSGNAEAQYALSSLLHQRGRFDESLQWLRRAAAQRLTAARLTLAILLTDGRQCPRDRQQAEALLAPLASTQIQANLLLSELHGYAALGGTDREAGLRYLMAAARMGDAGALRQLGLLGAGQRVENLVRPLLEAAARLGDGPASLVLSRQPAGGPAPGVDWAAVDHALPRLAADLPLPPVDTLSKVPLIRILRGVLPPAVVDGIVCAAAPLVKRSQIVDASTGEARIDPMRNSSHVTLGPRQHDHVVEAVERCVARVAGLPVANSEFLQILRYRPGEEFKPHVDYFNERGAGAYRSLADGGQRAHTVLIYLNDGYSGGRTYFPSLDLTIEARRGDLLHFENLGADGLGHRDTLHAGLPVLAGEKWLLSQWIRSRPYPARVAW